MEAIQSRMTFGSTEKIRRRNRGIWERLAAKIRRSLDKKEIRAGLEYLIGETSRRVLSTL